MVTLEELLAQSEAISKGPGRPVEGSGLDVAPTPEALPPIPTVPASPTAGQDYPPMGGPEAPPVSYESLLQESLQAGQAEPVAPGTGMPSAPGRTGSENFLGGVNKQISTLLSIASGLANPLAMHDTMQKALAELGMEYGVKGKGTPNLGSTTIKSEKGEYELSPTKMIPVEALLNKLGVKTGIDPDSLGGKIGRNVVNSLVTLGAMQAAAPIMASMEGMTTSAIMQRSFGEAMLKHPWLNIVGDLVGATPASTIGEEHFGAAGALGGGIGGQLAVSSAMTAGKHVAKYPQALVGKVSEILDKLSGMKPIPGLEKEADIIFGLPKGKPGATVSEHLLEPARQAEQRARIAGQGVVAQAEELRKAVPGSDAAIEGRLALMNAQAEERQAVAEAEKLWVKLPKDARGKYSREQEAIRAEFSDDMYAKQFAENQVNGDRQVVEDQLKHVFRALGPKPGDTRTTAQIASDIKNGIDEAEKLATTIEGRFWNRAPLKEKMPDRYGPRDDLEAFVARLRDDGFTEGQIPQKHVEMFNKLFEPPENPTGKFMPGSVYEGSMPTLGQVRGVISDMRSTIRAERATGDPAHPIIANLGKLEALANKWIADAFPKNIEIKQARAFSRMYHDMFSTSELWPFISQGARGAEKVHPEDAIKRLLRTDRGVQDLYNMTQKLQRQGRMIPGEDGMWTAINDQQKASLKQLREDMIAGVRSHFQDLMKEADFDPTRAIKTMDAFAPKIKAFGRVAAEFKQSSDTVGDLMTRRKEIEASAFAKYIKNDGEVAINKVWNYADPAAAARELIHGRAGVGGFSKDPIALEGFRGGLIDKFFQATASDPTKMTQVLQGRHGRLLKTALGEDTYDRLERVVDAAVKMEKGTDEKSTFMQAMLFAGRYIGVRVATLIPGKHQIQEGALFSQLAKRMITDAFRGGSPGAMMAEAVRNPSFERFMLSKVPETAQEVRGSISLMRRVMRMEVGMRGAIQSALGSGYETGRPKHDPASSAEPFGDRAPTSTRLPPETSVTPGIMVPQMQSDHPFSDIPGKYGLKQAVERRRLKTDIGNGGEDRTPLAPIDWIPSDQGQGMPSKGFNWIRRL